MNTENSNHKKPNLLAMKHAILALTKDSEDDLKSIEDVKKLKEVIESKLIDGISVSMIHNKLRSIGAFNCSLNTFKKYLEKAGVDYHKTKKLENDENKLFDEPIKFDKPAWESDDENKPQSSI